MAAIVGDPACKKESALAREINLDASAYLLKTAQTKGVKRFIFASTCSNYGKMSDSNGYVDEDSPLRPVSLYAELKVAFEKVLLESEYPQNFTVVGLRFATAYGLSPRMRFDLTVNEFARDFALGRELLVFGEQFWRPYCHVNDLSEGCIRVLEAQRSLVHRCAFNVGDTEENYQKQTIIKLLKERIPNAKVGFVQSIG